LQHFAQASGSGSKPLHATVSVLSLVTLANSSVTEPQTPWMIDARIDSIGRATASLGDLSILAQVIIGDLFALHV